MFWFTLLNNEKTKITEDAGSSIVELSE